MYELLSENINAVIGLAGVLLGAFTAIIGSSLAEKSRQKHEIKQNKKEAYKSGLFGLTTYIKCRSKILCKRSAKMANYELDEKSRDDLLKTIQESTDALYAAMTNFNLYGSRAVCLKVEALLI